MGGRLESVAAGSQFKSDRREQLNRCLHHAEVDERWFLRGPIPFGLKGKGTPRPVPRHCTSFFFTEFACTLANFHFVVARIHGD
jgi:hypothetical protein